MSKPIRPSEVKKLKGEGIPDEVFDVFNELIVARLQGRSAHIPLGVVAAAVSKALHLSRKDVLDKRLLDVEDHYRKAGWEVRYESSAWNESDFKPYFTFTAPKEKA